MACVNSELVPVLFSEIFNFILHNPAFLAKALVQWCDKLVWGTEFIVSAFFLFWSPCSPSIRRTWHTRGIAGPGMGKDRTKCFQSSFVLVVEHQPQCYLRILVTFKKKNIKIKINVGFNGYIHAAANTFATKWQIFLFITAACCLVNVLAQEELKVEF